MTQACIRKGRYRCKLSLAHMDFLCMPNLLCGDKACDIGRSSMKLPRCLTLHTRLPNAAPPPHGMLMSIAAVHFRCNCCDSNLPTPQLFQRITENYQVDEFNEFVELPPPPVPVSDVATPSLACVNEFTSEGKRNTSEGMPRALLKQEKAEPMCHISILQHIPCLSVTDDAQGVRYESKHHSEIKQLMQSRLESGMIFGESWKSLLGYLAPFGTQNSFLSRFKKSSTFKHIIFFDNSVFNYNADSALTETLDAKLTVAGTDASVNNCSLVCALLITIPTLILGELSVNNDRWLDYLQRLRDVTSSDMPCLHAAVSTSQFSDFCLLTLQDSFERLYFAAILCFYSSMTTLFLAVFYYMCRPSESSSCSSIRTLFEAHKIEIRDRIRRLSRCHDQSVPGAACPTNAASPHDSLQEIEVFLNAQFLAQSHMEGQLNQAFFMWYKS